MHINSPIPKSLPKEIKKACKTASSFLPHKKQTIDNKLIPQSLLVSAKGFAIITVLKGGFLFSGRLGSGIVVAKLPDGSWSAPSAIGLASVGDGGQIGGELVELFILLMSDDAVKAFMHSGNLSLGANISIAAGPTGRDGQVSGTLLNTAGLVSYSKTKGLFIGVSIEGDVVFQRSDANKKFYGRPIKAKEILSGAVPPPDICGNLYRVLNLLTGNSTNEIQPPPYANNLVITRSPSSPEVPLRRIEAVAKRDFIARRPDELPFKQGDRIMILDRSTDWWKGSANGIHGIFPSRNCF
ncbi:DUF500-domain-containing protein [Rozella allomycis CSF55]|uniref:DUF500-domain-containing protein n=1 Tax=Rozella allomycis (strain CSF55) TaxID=988480 RepID=A0A075B5B2_ROZAC|nr:Ysc84 actin-binding domain-containing protein [Rozella allomycis CSF55]RKP17574.1 DUF500-domain-containing protein [Rozella allomycis CSF55]|eukprot:EPZ37044.1 Ysc84 actin-binding domain-containing protein [Rozella allomycis CSF55]